MLEAALAMVCCSSSRPLWACRVSADGCWCCMRQELPQLTHLPRTITARGTISPQVEEPSTLGTAWPLQANLLPTGQFGESEEHDKSMHTKLDPSSSLDVAARTAGAGTDAVQDGAIPEVLLGFLTELDSLFAEGEDSLLLSSLSAVVHDPSGTDKPVTTHQAVKRFAGANCTNVVWESTTTVVGAAFAAYPPFQLTARGWARLLPTRLDDGSFGTVAHEVKAITLTLLEPVRGLPRGNGRGMKPVVADREVAPLMGLLPTLVLQKDAQTHQVIENVLLDASVAARRT